MIIKKTLILLLVQFIFTVADSLPGLDYIINVYENLKNQYGQSKSNKFMQAKLSSSIFEEALQELCPFPGFSGNYCPGYFEMTQKEFSQSGLPTMPQGIGSSFDVTTGKLKLPSIQLTYEQNPNPEQIWTDPLSNNQFIIAEETNIEQVEVSPDINIFRNEADFTNVWLDALQRGQWLGGQYSQLKDVNEVYQQFFNGEQETSISQLLKNVVRLSFKSDNLQLNRFAQRAVNSLPQDYIEEIYNDFLESWGTHVAVDTYIGGMIEKQTVFKDCVTSSPSFTGGLSDDQLVQALNNELHGNQADGFFVARRRVSIDHKLGGNPEDVSNWEQTISQNPALLKINRFVSWDDLVSDSQIKANLQRAIQNKIEQVKQIRLSQQQQIQEQKRLLSNEPKTAYSFTSVGFVFEEKTYQHQFQMMHASSCPPGESHMATRNKCRSLNLDQIDYVERILSVRYERDDQGNFRTVYNNILLTDLDQVVYGNWVNKGCSVVADPRYPQYADLNQPSYLRLPGIICTDCIPEKYNGSNGDLLQCNCPAF